jgi:hypothetical protein
LANRFADVVNVKDFGAVGDGVTDDTVAIQAAINAASSINGGAIIFPSGSFRITSQLSITSSGISMLGQGCEAYAVGTKGTEIAWHGSNSIGTTMLFMQFVDACRIEGIAFNCRNLAEYGIQAQGVKLSRFYNINIRDFTYTGFKGYCGDISGQWSSTNILENFLITSANNGVVGLSLDGSSIANNDWFNNVFINGFIQVARTTTASNAVVLDFCDSNTFIECDINVYGVGNGNALVFKSGTRDFYPQNNFFYGCSVLTTSVVEGSGKFISDNAFVNFPTKDAEVIPNHPKLHITTDTFDSYGVGNINIRKNTSGIHMRSETQNRSWSVFSNINDSSDLGLQFIKDYGLPSQAVYMSVFPSVGTIPGADDLYTLGASFARWSLIYAASATINTSDEREKTFLEIEESEKLAALEIKSNLRKFKFNSAIEKKGNNARIHFGASAQQVGDIMKSHGLDPSKYGFYCYDEWDEQPEVKDSDGNIIQEYRPAGNRYGLRYEELLAFIISAI